MSVLTTAADNKRLAALLPLLGELNDLKRIRTAACERGSSLAELGFRRVWSELAAGEAAPAQLAISETAAAVAAARLAGMDSASLRRMGLTAGQTQTVLERGLDAVAKAIEPKLAQRLRAALAGLARAETDTETPAPVFADALCRQPRAGATRPGQPRLMLEPPESHGDHCYVTAVSAALVAPLFGADPTLPFLAGLSHHLHNAVMPDAGFTGEVLLGDWLEPMVERLTCEVIERAALAPKLAQNIEQARGLLSHAETAEARAFHAADVLDRVLQMRQYARVAAFELEHALEELELVHPGPLQDYQLGVLRDSGLCP